MVLYPVSRDIRYTVTKEHGFFVARFGDEILGQSRFYVSAAGLCIGRHAIERGAEVVTALEQEER